MELGTQGGASCAACPLGKSQPQAGQSSCNNCSAGFYQNATGHAHCKPCPAGYYQSQPGMSSCIACAAGRRQPVVGQREPYTWRAVMRRGKQRLHVERRRNVVGLANLADPGRYASLLMSPGHVR